MTACSCSLPLVAKPAGPWYSAGAAFGGSSYSPPRAQADPGPSPSGLILGFAAFCCARPSDYNSLLRPEEPAADSLQSSTLEQGCRFSCSPPCSLGWCCCWCSRFRLVRSESRTCEQQHWTAVAPTLGISPPKAYISCSEIGSADQRAAAGPARPT